jgi:2-polyprenyl-3-methyl-5-hydroxy-6-metoxy-1,4-benzoquinol methylase
VNSLRQVRLFARRIKSQVRSGTTSRAIVEFKSDIWQTREGSDWFIKGSDANEVALADVMNREVNVFFLNQCNQADNVLDIGSGHGIVSEFLARHGINVTAMDTSDRFLEEFRERVAGMDLPLTITHGDAYDIPTADASFDKVVARMFLPHFPNWSLILKELARVTVPGGLIMIHFPSRENGLTGARLGDKDCRFATDPDTEDPWTFYAETDERELLDVSRKLNLRIVSRVPICFFADNRIIGHQIGQEHFDRYQSELAERLKDPAVKDFVVWFDEMFTANAAPALSHFAIVTFEKR